VDDNRIVFVLLRFLRHKGEMRSRKVHNWMSDYSVVGVSLLCRLRCRDISKLWKERCVVIIISF
jgi:hypothetical protein